MPDNDRPISQLSGTELLDYLSILSQRQAAFSKLKIDLIETLKPIEANRAEKRADIQKVIEAQRQTKIEISAVKFALKAAAEGLT